MGNPSSQSIGVISITDIVGLIRSDEFTLFFPIFNERIIEVELERTGLSFKSLNYFSIDTSCYNSRNYEGDGYYLGNFGIYV